MSTTLEGKPLSSIYTYQSYEADDSQEVYAKQYNPSFFYGYHEEAPVYNNDNAYSIQEDTDTKKAKPAEVITEQEPEKPIEKSNDNFLIDFYWNEKFQVIFIISKKIKSLKLLLERPITTPEYSCGIPSLYTNI
jgi:hypothetical protein